METVKLNAKRARFILEYWGNDPTGLPQEALLNEIWGIQTRIEEMAKSHPEMSAQFRELYQAVATKEFWESLAKNMKGTKFSACGLRFKSFTYDSMLKLPQRKAGCLSRLFRLLVVAWLVWYGIKLWSPPPGDAPAPASALPAVENNLKTQIGDEL